MKRLILFELIVLFLATTFESDSPPGWFQQVLPVSDQVTDIFFLDSSNGWITTRKAINDTARILYTSNGGTNWIIQHQQVVYFTAIQFLDINTGYSCAGTGGGSMFKTTNGGQNWNIINGSFSSALFDLFFVNKDTGWTCSPLAFGGLYQTVNGGSSWQTQLGAGFSIKKLFFISKDTGWAGSDEANGKLYRTTNGGLVWNLQYTSNGAVESIFFLNNQKGWIRGGTGNGVAYTTDGGLTWQNAQGDVAGYDLRFVNDSIGYSGMIDFKVIKSTNGGKNWGYQTSPIISNLSTWMLRGDTMQGWAGGIGFIKTTDGGGPITYIGITPNSNIASSFELKQNYPNPFNPATIITFEIRRNSKVSLKIFNILGEETDELIDYEKHNAGLYTVNYEADDEMASGIYFYQMTAWTEDKKEIFIDTKKMILLK